MACYCQWVAVQSLPQNKQAIQANQRIGYSPLYTQLLMLLPAILLPMDEFLALMDGTPVRRSMVVAISNS